MPNMLSIITTECFVMLKKPGKQSVINTKKDKIQAIWDKIDSLFVKKVFLSSFSCSAFCLAKISEISLLMFSSVIFSGNL